jgi:hypothetical protein
MLQCCYQAMDATRGSKYVLGLVEKSVLVMNR